MRRIFSAVVIAALAISLSGCAAGNNASTRQVKQVTDGVEGAINKDGNDIKILNLLVVAAGGGNAVLVGTIINNADAEDVLLGIAINGTTLAYTGTNTLPKNSPIIFEGDSANAKAVLAGFGGTAGSNVKVGLFFAKAGSITLDAIVRDTRDAYAGVTGAIDVPMVSPSPTPTPTK
jgi:hypothetical protein